MKLLIEAMQSRANKEGMISSVVIDSLDFTIQGIAGQAKALATMKTKYAVSRSAMTEPMPITFRFHECYNNENPSKPCITKEVS